MKLKNRKTGEIIDLSVGFIKDTYNGRFIQVKPVAISNKEGYLYETLADFNDEWEDYEPVEPLIKDKKVRKAVRAWAEANDVWRVFVGGFDALMCKSKGIEIDFGGKPFKRIFNEWKTIDELCGEEED